VVAVTVLSALYWRGDPLLFIVVAVTVLSALYWRGDPLLSAPPAR
jgi:uncharacterized membrane protein